MNEFTFSSVHRLLTAQDFEAVFEAPIKKIHSTHFLLFVAQTKQPYARLGLAITKKKLKKAVDRNLVKRQTREIFRLNQNHLPALDCVLIVKNGSFIQVKNQKINKNTALLIVKTELNEIFAKLVQMGLTHCQSPTYFIKTNSDDNA